MSQSFVMGCVKSDIRVKSDTSQSDKKYLDLYAFCKNFCETESIQTRLVYDYCVDNVSDQIPIDIIFVITKYCDLEFSTSMLITYKYKNESSPQIIFNWKYIPSAMDKSSLIIDNIPTTSSENGSFELIKHKILLFQCIFNSQYTNRYSIDDNEIF